LQLNEWPSREWLTVANLAIPRHHLHCNYVL
jgi:hypothetical protein